MLASSSALWFGLCAKVRLCEVKKKKKRERANLGADLLRLFLGLLTDKADHLGHLRLDLLDVVVVVVVVVERGLG